MGASLALLLGAPGCLGTIGAEGALVYGYPATFASVVPVDIQQYPHAYYRGRYAYLVDGSWYYPTSEGWVVFREEPVELRRYRTPRRSPRYVAPEQPYSYPEEQAPRYYTPR